MKKVVRAIFKNPNEMNAADIAQSQDLKKLLKDQLPEVIKLALKHNKKFATIFEINDSNNYVELSNKNWIKALETCLLWYVEDENYEMCTKIKNLISDIQTNASKNKLQLDNTNDGF